MDGILIVELSIVDNVCASDIVVVELKDIGTVDKPVIVLDEADMVKLVAVEASESCFEVGFEYVVTVVVPAGIGSLVELDSVIVTELLTETVEVDVPDNAEGSEIVSPPEALSLVVENGSELVDGVL